MFRTSSSVMFLRSDLRAKQVRLAVKATALGLCIVSVVLPAASQSLAKRQAPAHRSVVIPAASKAAAAAGPDL